MRAQRSRGARFLAAVIVIALALTAAMAKGESSKATSWENDSHRRHCGFDMRQVPPPVWAPTVLASAELYDPGTGSFRLVGSLTVARNGFTATLLKNGKVLIAGGGGRGFGEVYSSAELYDPNSRQFSSTGSMSAERFGHTATLLPDGRVLVAAGSEDGPAAELYDPLRGKFEKTGRMIVEREGPAAALLDNGTVLVAGGYDPENQDHMLYSAELYSPRTGRFVRTGSMRAGSADATAISLKGHQVLFIGGRENWQGTVPEIYESRTGAFRPAGVHLARGDLYSAVLLRNGKVLLTGGEDPASSNALLYDPQTQVVRKAGEMAVARQESSSTLLRDGRVLIVGGFQRYEVEGEGLERYLASAELYDPSDGSFRPTGDMKIARAVSKTVLLGDGQVLIMGGISSASQQ